MDSIYLLSKYPFLPLYVVVVAFSLWRFPRYYDTVLQLLPVFLMYTLLTELLGVIVYEFDAISIFSSEFFRAYNWLIYNIYNLVFTAYFLFVYYRSIPGKPQRLLIVAGMCLMGIVSVANTFFQSFQYEVQLATYCTGSLLLILTALMYLRYRSRTTGKIAHAGDLLSWISLGLVVFHTGFIPVTLQRSVDSLSGLLPQGLPRPLMNGLIFFLYGCFILGFARMTYARKFLKSDRRY